MWVAAARTGQLINYSDMARDVGVSEPALKSWLNVLHATGVVHLLQPYFNNMNKRLLKTPKLYFMDTGFCCYLSGWLTADVLERGAMAGALLETFVVSELLKSIPITVKIRVYISIETKTKWKLICYSKKTAILSIEVKKTASIKNIKTNAFKRLDKMGLTVGEGAVLCLLVATSFKSRGHCDSRRLSLKSTAFEEFYARIAPIEFELTRRWIHEFKKQSGVIWMDGEYVPWEEANVHVLTHTLHYGLGAFEGVRAMQLTVVSIFHLQDHTRRLFESAKILNMQVPYTPDELDRVQCELVKKNGLDSAYLRPMIFLGGGSLGLHAEGLKTRVVVAAWSWGAYLGDEGMEKGIKVRTSSYRRIHVDSLHAKAKANGHYINSMLALQEAVAAGCDEALLLDHQGCVAEGSGENFFMVRGDTLYTPKKLLSWKGLPVKLS